MGTIILLATLFTSLTTRLPLFKWLALTFGLVTLLSLPMLLRRVGAGRTRAVAGLRRLGDATRSGVGGVGRAGVGADGVGVLRLGFRHQARQRHAARGAELLRAAALDRAAGDGRAGAAELGAGSGDAVDRRGSWDSSARA